MATSSFVTALKSARANAILTYVGDAAKFIIYDGTRPANANTAISGNTELATFTLGTPFATESNGVLTWTAVSNVNADNTGTATWARLLKADGTTVVMDLDCGTSGTSVVLNTTSVVAGGPLAIVSATFSEPA